MIPLGRQPIKASVRGQWSFSGIKSHTLYFCNISFLCPALKSKPVFPNLEFFQLCNAFSREASHFILFFFFQKHLEWKLRQKIIGCCMYPTQAATTKYYKLGSLPNRNFSLTVLEIRSPRSRSGRVCFLRRVFLACRQQHSKSVF